MISLPLHMLFRHLSLPHTLSSFRTLGEATEPTQMLRWLELSSPANPSSPSSLLSEAVSMSSNDKSSSAQTTINHFSIWNAVLQYPSRLLHSATLCNSSIKVLLLVIFMLLLAGTRSLRQLYHCHPSLSLLCLVQSTIREHQFKM